MQIIFFIAIHYNTFKISNISCGFVVSYLYNECRRTIISIVIVESFILYRKGAKICFPFFLQRCENFA